MPPITLNLRTSDNIRLFDEAVAIASDGGPEDIPQQLYHYTTEAGLNGILSSGAIWAGSIDHLNDTTEWKFGVQQCLDALHTAPAAGDAGLIADILAKDVQRRARYMAYFIASFCPNDRNHLSWTRYADNAAGYCLEFDLRRMAKGTRDAEDQGDERLHTPGTADAPQRGSLGGQRRPYGIYLAEAVYDAAAQRTRVHDVFATLAQAYDVGIRSARNAEIRDRVWRNGLVVGGLVLRLLIPTFKHPDFSQEEEWRLIAFGTDTDPDILVDRRHRVAGGALVPYMPLSLGGQGAPSVLPLTRVVCGARAPIAAVETIGRLLTIHTLDAAVSRSAIPLR